MSDENCEVPVSKDAPVMIAWNAYKASDRYSIVKKWATYPEHVDGQLWAAFYAGFSAASVNEVPRVVERHIAGLREAAEILEDEGFLGLSMQRILARIAELEQKP